ncbi:MAG: DUF6316 family protein [Woeseiaceae bacterium]
MMQVDRRTGEIGLLPFRTRRIFNVGPNWFFAVREGRDRGPYTNELEAKDHLNEYLGAYASFLQH